MEILWGFLSNLVVAIISIGIWLFIWRKQKLAEDKKDLSIELFSLLESYKHMLSKARAHQFSIIDWRELWQNCFEEAQNKIKLEWPDTLQEDEIHSMEANKLVSETQEMENKLYIDWKFQMEDLFSRILLVSTKAFLFGEDDQSILRNLIQYMYVEVYNVYTTSMDKYIRYCHSWKWNIDPYDSDERQSEYNKISDIIFYERRTSEYTKKWTETFNKIRDVLKKHTAYEISAFKF